MIGRLGVFVFTLTKWANALVRMRAAFSSGGTAAYHLFNSAVVTGSPACRICPILTLTL